MHFFGMEFGSTRIKAVVIDKEGKVLASGAYSWENRLADGLWTYSEEEIIHGMQTCYSGLASEYAQKTGKPLYIRKLERQILRYPERKYPNHYKTIITWARQDFRLDAADEMLVREEE